MLQCVVAAKTHRMPDLDGFFSTKEPYNSGQFAGNDRQVEASYESSQCVAVCCSALQCVAVCCSDLHVFLQKSPVVVANSWKMIYESRHPTSLRSVSQCVALCCIVLQCVAVCCSVLQCVAVCCRKVSTS